MLSGAVSEYNPTQSVALPGLLETVVLSVAPGAAGSGVSATAAPGDASSLTMVPSPSVSAIVALVA